MSSAIGERAERLAWLFGSVPRSEIFAALTAPSDGSSAGLRDRWGGRVVADRRELGALAVIALANAADDGRMSAGGPRPWLAGAARVAHTARPLLERAPPIFDGCRTVIDAELERRVVEAYGRGWQPPFGAGVDDAVAAAVRAMPVGEPFVWLGLRALAGTRGTAFALSECGSRASALLRAWGTSWDKRLAQSQWLELAGFLVETAAAPPAARDFVAERLAAILADGAPPHVLYAQLRSIDVLPKAAGDDALPARFRAYAARFAGNHERPLMGRYPGLAARPWHDPAAFPIVAALEANAAAIAAEVAALRSGEFHSESENIARDGDWDVFLLFERGRVPPAAAARCPQTLAVLERHGAIRGLAGLAYVSRLAPHTAIAPHRGPTNMRLRCHLGIDIPPGCGLAVDGVTGGWTPGRCIVFDDSFEHRAWNDGPAERIVLVVDVWHPDLQPAEIALLTGLHRYAHAHADNLARYWARNARAAAGAPPAAGDISVLAP